MVLTVEHPHRVPVQGGPVSPDQLGEGRPITKSTAASQHLVGPVRD